MGHARRFCRTMEPQISYLLVVGEMTILIEEVGYMLQITPDPGKKGEPSFGVPCF